VDRARGGTPRLIWAVRRGLDGQGRARACNGGVCAGEVIRTVACGGDSPALPLGSAPGHQNIHKLVHFVAGAHAYGIGGLGGCSCLVGDRHRKGTARLLRRACECAKVHKMKEN
jgi:hypothetical protein